MNWAHVHLVLTHIPVVGIGFGVVLLALAWWRKSPELLRVGLGALVLVTIATLLVFLTGEPAEEMVEDLPGVAEQLIDRHAEVAKLALLAGGLVGVVALIGLLRYWYATTMPGVYIAVLLVLTTVTGGAMAWTANLGGQIRHPEIRIARHITAQEDEENQGFWRKSRSRIHQGEEDKDEDR